MISMRQKLVAEAFGTFVLIFIGTGAIVVNDVTSGAVTLMGVAATFGLVVMAMIYAFGDVSGAHINPAVTIGFFLAGRFPGKSVVPYILAQLAGAFAASLLLRAMFTDHPNLGITAPAGSLLRLFVLEVVLTMILMFVVLRVAFGSKETGVMAGIAIGGVIAFEILFAGPISGASMNPARSLAPAVVSGQVQHLWIYLVATVLGAAAAVPLWWLTLAPQSAEGPPV
ncbi:MAG: aquaporin [Tepidisphaeraceae bacterium]